MLPATGRSLAPTRGCCSRHDHRLGEPVPGASCWDSSGVTAMGAWVDSRRARYLSRVLGEPRCRWQKKHRELCPARGEPSVCLRDCHRQRLDRTFQRAPECPWEST